MSDGERQTECGGGAKRRKAVLTYREHPVRYVLVCLCLLLASTALLWYALVGSWANLSEGMWWVEFGGVVVLAGVMIGFAHMVGSFVRGASGDGEGAQGRAEWWKTVRSILFVLCASATLASVFCFVAAYATWVVSPDLADYANAAVQMKKAMTRLHVEACSEAMQWGIWGAVWITVGVGLFWSARRIRGRIRSAEGRCVACGYSLRGLPESRCPECGMRFNPADLEGLSMPRVEAEGRRGG